MADNLALPPSSASAATDQVTYSGDAGVHVQLIRPVLVSGAEGARTVVDLTGDGTNGLDVDVTRVIPGTGATALGKAEDATSADGDTGVMLLGIRNYAGAGADGDYSAVTVASDGHLIVDVMGNIAHDSPDSTEPVKIGAKAESSPAGITLVADADRTDLYADLDGLLITKPFTAYGDILVERLSNTDGNSTASTVFGATANARNCITTIAVYNSSATNGYIDFRDGTAGTILFTLPVPAYGGAVTNFPLPLRQTTANTAFAYDVSAAISTVYISLIGFKSKA